MFLSLLLNIAECTDQGALCEQSEQQQEQQQKHINRITQFLRWVYWFLL
ncbi:hypothetical protein [Marinicella sp. W31]